jgi:hypothetical protein
MKNRLLALLLVSLLILEVFLIYSFLANTHTESSPDVFIGISIAYGDVADAKALIDQVSSYTNLVVIGTNAIVSNATKLNETFQYAYCKGLSFTSLVPLLGHLNRTEWFEYANQTWGDHFLGFYAYDEPAGRQLDLNETRVDNTTANNYAEAANQFENNMSSELNAVRLRQLNSTNYPLFTSDYALYWFDYKAGYDVVFSELGWNNSRQLNVALIRGAATVQNKDWGAIILWTYTVPPYIESGAELYKDLMLAYDNGAKYIVVFDGNADYTGGILTEGQLQALQQFWQYVQDNPRRSNPNGARTAYVLPDGFGYGFRGPNDKIWGLWEANPLSYNISVSVGSLLQEYGTKLDIIYDDGLQPGNNYGYNQLIYWNAYGPPPSQSPSPSPSPWPSTSPLNSPFASASRSPSSSPQKAGAVGTLMGFVYVGIVQTPLIVIVVAVVTLVFKKRTK